MSEMLPEMKAKQKDYHLLQNYRIKSKIQSYDIRDAPEYQGILELEKELLSTTDLTVAMLRKTGQDLKEKLFLRTKKLDQYLN